MPAQCDQLLLVLRGDDANIQILRRTTAVLKPVDETDLAWRGVSYKTYHLQTLTDWKPVLSPPAGDPFYGRIPH